MSLSTNTHLCHAPHALNDDKVPIGEIWRPVVPVNQRFDFKTNRNRPQTYCLFSMFFPPHIRCQVGHHIAEWIEGAQWQLKNEISIRHQTTRIIIILYPKKWNVKKTHCDKKSTKESKHSSPGQGSHPWQRSFHLFARWYNLKEWNELEENWWNLRVCSQSNISISIVICSRPAMAKYWLQDTR